MIAGIVVILTIVSAFVLGLLTAQLLFGTFRVSIDLSLNEEPEHIEIYDEEKLYGGSD